MDPNACFQRMLDAIDEEEWDAAIDAAGDLVVWVRNGGSLPTPARDEWLRHLIILQNLIAETPR